jgi:hypothetical protein
MEALLLEEFDSLVYGFRDEHQQLDDDDFGFTVLGLLHEVEEFSQEVV